MTPPKQDFFTEELPNTKPIPKIQRRSTEENEMPVK